MLLLVFTLVLHLSEYQCQDNPIVTTPLGKIRGYHKKSFTQKVYSAFEGIPYAKPPVGENRFEESQPTEGWDGIWDALYLYKCAQYETDSNGVKTILGDEDCLYVNVYVPRDQPNPIDKLQVIVHIHGGAFTEGSGDWAAFPGYIMDHPDIIFVTFNYRLGIFGFLSTEDEIVPGNNGLKDQVLALKWVQQNIESFGGDSGSVTLRLKQPFAGIGNFNVKLGQPEIYRKISSASTLTGVSAGGASVHLHYLSPMSKGLFHKGFPQSGCALNPWVINRRALNDTQETALSVGCPINNTKALVDCLKQRTYHQLLNGVKITYKTQPSVHRPVVEKSSLKEPFLRKDPYHLLLTKQVHTLPWLTSIVTHEGEFVISNFKNNMDTLNSLWPNLAPVILKYSAVPQERWSSIAKKVKDFYLGKNQNFSSQNYDKLVKIVSDKNIAYGCVKSVKLQANSTNASVYFYQMSYSGGKDTVDHADDQKYFYYDEAEPYPSADELRMKDLSINLLLSFVRTGKPAVEGIIWKPATPTEFNFLNVSGFQKKDIKLQVDKDFASGDFWDSLDLSENSNF